MWLRAWARLDRDLVYASYLFKDTGASYIDLLEKSFVLFRLEAWSRNLRSEITRSPKIYFVDNGVRNVAIGDSRHFSLRNDQGELWENYIVSERRKRPLSEEVGVGPRVGSRFWRLKAGAEIDYVEEAARKLSSWEIKLSPKAAARPSKSWKEAYPEAVWAKVDRSNYLEFIVGDRPRRAGSQSRLCGLDDAREIPVYFKQVYDINQLRRATWTSPSWSASSWTWRRSSGP